MTAGVAWGLVALVLGLGWWAGSVGELRGEQVDRRGWVWLAGLGTLVAAARAVWAVGRPVRNVDEAQYAAAGAFARFSGESLFAVPVGWRGHLPLYVVGGAWPYPFVDTVTSLVVGGTSVVLGACAWRAAGRWAGVVTALLYPLVLLNCEGLSSNAEPYANLALALYLWVRVVPEASRRRLVAGGVCLGAAGVLKEQAWLFVVLEPWVEGWPGGRWRAWVGRELWAALGCVAVVAGLLGVFAAYGSLERYLAWTLGFARDLGHVESFGARPGWGQGVVETARHVVVNPVGWLGLAALAGAWRGSGARDPAVRAWAGVVVVGVGVAWVGRRWFAHYFMYAGVGLAPLAGWWLASAVRQPRRWGIAAVVWGALCVGPWWWGQARGFAEGLWEDPRELQERWVVAEALAGATEEGEPVWVYGWRPELYGLAERPPASRYRVGWLLRLPEEALLEDLERYPPGALAVSRQELFALERRPKLAAWVAAEGFEVLGETPGWRVLVRGSLRSHSSLRSQSKSKSKSKSKRDL